MYIGFFPINRVVNNAKCNCGHNMRVHMCINDTYRYLKFCFLCVRVSYLYSINLLIILCVAEKISIISNKCFIISKIEPSSYTKCRQ